MRFGLFWQRIRGSSASTFVNNFLSVLRGGGHGKLPPFSNTPWQARVSYLRLFQSRGGFSSAARSTEHEYLVKVSFGQFFYLSKSKSSLEKLYLSKSKM